MTEKTLVAVAALATATIIIAVAWLMRPNPIYDLTWWTLVWFGLVQPL